MIAKRLELHKLAAGRGILSRFLARANDSLMNPSIRNMFAGTAVRPKPLPLEGMHNLKPRPSRLLAGDPMDMSTATDAFRKQMASGAWKKPLAVGAAGAAAVGGTAYANSGNAIGNAVYDNTVKPVADTLEHIQALGAAPAAPNAPAPTTLPAEAQGNPIWKYLPHAGLAAAGGLGLYAMYQNAKKQEERAKQVPLVNMLPKTAADQAKFAADYPFVTGFLVACHEAGLTELQIREKIAVAARIDVDFAEEFYNAFVKEAIGLPDLTKPLPAEHVAPKPVVMPNAPSPKLSLGAMGSPKPPISPSLLEGLSSMKAPRDPASMGPAPMAGADVAARAAWRQQGSQGPAPLPANPHWDAPAMTALGTAAAAPLAGGAAAMAAANPTVAGVIAPTVYNGAKALGKEFLANEGVNAGFNVATGENPLAPANTITGAVLGVGQPAPVDPNAAHDPVGVEQGNGGQMAAAEDATALSSQAPTGPQPGPGPAPGQTQAPAAPGPGAPPQAWDEFAKAITDDPSTPVNEKLDAIKPFVEQVTSQSGLPPEEIAKFVQQAETQGLQPSQMQDAFQRYTEQLAASSPEAMNQPGFIEQAWNSFKGMDGGTQALLGLGLGLGVIGLLNSANGGNGLGSVLMMLLGFGTAAFTGARGGMFGPDAQGLTQGAADTVNGMFSPQTLPQPGEGFALSNLWKQKLDDPNSDVNKTIGAKLNGSAMAGFGKFVDGAMGTNFIGNQIASELTQQLHIEPQAAQAIAAEYLKRQQQPAPNQGAGIQPAQLDGYQSLRAGGNPNLPNPASFAAGLA